MVLGLNPGLEELDRDDDDQPLPAGITTIVLPLDVDDATLAEAVEESRRIIEERVSGFGVSEAEVTLVGDNRINAQIPGVDADDASGLVGSIALLEFARSTRFSGSRRPR